MSDLIDRKNALEAIEKMRPTVWTNSDYELGQMNQWTADEIAIATVQKAQDWIPVSERLPQDNGIYLVSYHYSEWGEIHSGVAISMFGNRGRWYLDGWWCDKEHSPVKAWMPLPKEYEEDD